MPNESDDEMRKSAEEPLGPRPDTNRGSSARHDIDPADGQNSQPPQPKQGNPMDKFNTALRKILSVPKKGYKHEINLAAIFVRT
jgi:hypothetical protein